MQATSTMVVIKMNVEHFTLGHKKKGNVETVLF